jgi:hypothetical protein
MTRNDPAIDRLGSHQISHGFNVNIAHLPDVPARQLR